MSKKLDDVLSNINKRFGDGSIMVLGDATLPAVECISTGSLMIDKILGGGIARGRVTEIWAMESGGKTSLCLQVAAECQRNGGKVAFIDQEQALSLKYAKTLGVNVDDLIFSQPNTAEEAMDIIQMLAESGEVDLIILDSVGALCPQAELDGEIGDITIGLVARLMSKFLRKISPVLNQTNCTLICINQIRQKINTGFSMGDPNTTTGGNALKFFASQRIELKKTTAIKEGEDVVGFNSKIVCKKNKIAVPMQSCQTVFMFNKGFGGSDEVLDLALAYDLVQASGAWFTTHDGQRIKGKANVREYYQSNPEIYRDLEDKVKAIIAGLEIAQEIEIDETTGQILEN